jgi:hypothetical protein
LWINGQTSQDCEHVLVRRLGSRQKGETVLFPSCAADFSQFGFMPVFTTMSPVSAGIVWTFACV